jgi:hypothetical protein
VALGYSPEDLPSPPRPAALVVMSSLRPNSLQMVTPPQLAACCGRMRVGVGLINDNDDGDPAVTSMSSQHLARSNKASLQPLGSQVGQARC